MAVTLRKYLNNQLKAKGLTAAEAKKNAGKYKSIAAAKKAGSLYYTGKDGKVMAAVYADDLKKPLQSIKPKKKPLRSSIKPKARPTSVKRITKAPKKADPEAAKIAKLTVVQIQKNPGMMTRLEQLQVELANLENRVAKAKKAGTLDRRADVQIPVVKRKIKNLKEKMKGANK
jgi:hypothetical protein